MDQPQEQPPNRFIYLSDEEASICQQALSSYLDQDLTEKDLMTAYHLAGRIKKNRTARIGTRS
ncbi:hypothetical protein N836_31585 [Leptolyngbya sp. Heron Island J]|uniref:hypothetical protein n=1 Tax=Leptolyngbya sp. Heron Island J TaxID=1385935 RepID=UPI0003B99C7B|nr:hypothetical protein [Leptolyngbya sp. Heron Island J]ESA38484.1 hypothetical protein N836_31585 [Leptolyngbya sp. Heron Island J]